MADASILSSRDREARQRLHIRLANGSPTASGLIPLPPSRNSLVNSQTPLPPPLSPTSAPTKLSLPSSTLSGSDSYESDSSDERSGIRTDPIEQGPSMASDNLSGGVSSGSEIASSDDQSYTEDANNDLEDLIPVFDDFINGTGDVNQPVVDVWYDLDMVSEVEDPDHFFNELEELKR